MNRHRMTGRIVAAVSGGADSVGLVHILRELKADLVGIAHFNHKLRGDESDGDERFVAALASKLDLPFYRSGGRPEKGNLEQSARHARRDFFLQLIRDGACDRIALGHTLDDQAETVLFRILRGSGLDGLAGIHPVTSDGFIRPLINIRRAELRALNFESREDSSNKDRRFARNRIRHDLLPQLRRDWNPNIDVALAQLADIAFEERALDPIDLDLDRLRSMPRALARRTIRAAIRQAKGDLKRIEFQHIEAILELKSGQLVLPGLQVSVSMGQILLAVFDDPPASPLDLAIPGTYERAGIRVESAETVASGCVNLRVDLTVPIVLRGWRPGDHYRPVGKSRDQKLKEMFQRARVPSWRRAAWPILESEGKILWAREFGPAEEFSVTDGPGPVLRIWDLATDSQRLML